MAIAGRKAGGRGPIRGLLNLTNPGVAPGSRHGRFQTNNAQPPNLNLAGGQIGIIICTCTSPRIAQVSLKLLFKSGQSPPLSLLSIG
jgi:hypothetical protein